MLHCFLDFECFPCDLVQGVPRVILHTDITLKETTHAKQLEHFGFELSAEVIQFATQKWSPKDSQTETYDTYIRYALLSGALTYDRANDYIAHNNIPAKGSFGSILPFFALLFQLFTVCFVVFCNRKCNTWTHVCKCTLCCPPIAVKKARSTALQWYLNASASTCCRASPRSQTWTALPPVFDLLSLGLLCGRHLLALSSVAFKRLDTELKQTSADTVESELDHKLEMSLSDVAGTRLKRARIRRSCCAALARQRKMTIPFCKASFSASGRPSLSPCNTCQRLHTGRSHSWKCLRCPLV